MNPWSFFNTVVGVIQDVLDSRVLCSRRAADQVLRSAGRDPKAVWERMRRVAEQALADREKPASLQRLEAAPFRACNSNSGRDTHVRAFRPELYVDERGNLGCSKEAAASMLLMEAEGVLRLDEHEYELLMNKVSNLRWEDHPDGVHEILVDREAYAKTPEHMRHHVGGLMRPKPDWKKR